MICSVSAKKEKQDTKAIETERLPLQVRRAGEENKGMSHAAIQGE